MTRGVKSREAVKGTISVVVDAWGVRARPIARRGVGAMVDETLARLSLRGLVRVSGQHVTIDADGRDVLAYYAATIDHHFDDAAVQKT